MVHTSVSSNPNVGAVLSIRVSTLRWLTWTPLGRPVDPECVDDVRDRVGQKWCRPVRVGDAMGRGVIEAYRDLRRSEFDDVYARFDDLRR